MGKTLVLAITRVLTSRLPISRRSKCTRFDTSLGGATTACFRLALPSSARAPFLLGALWPGSGEDPGDGPGTTPELDCEDSGRPPWLLAAAAVFVAAKVVTWDVPRMARVTLGLAPMTVMGNSTTVGLSLILEGDGHATIIDNGEVVCDARDRHKLASVVVMCESMTRTCDVHISAG